MENSSSKQQNLKFLHARASLNEVKLNAFRKASSEDLIRSLGPEEPGALKARVDGTLLDGHHRLAVLEERGVNIHGLPRVILKKEK